MVGIVNERSAFDVFVKILLLPVNEHKPIFSPKSVNVNEDAQLGLIITNFTAKDLDFTPHDIQSYAIINGWFFFFSNNFSPFFL